MIIKWTTYSAYFLILNWLSQEKDLKKWMETIFQMLGMFIISHVYMVKLGWIKYPNIEVAGRLGGVFQYPNTFGMVMALYFLYSLLMFLDKNHSIYKNVLLLFPLPFMLTGFLLSYSKGMFLIFPLFWIIALFLLNFEDQIIYIFITLITSLSTFIVLFFTIFKGMDFSTTLIPLILFSMINIILFIAFKKYIINLGNKKKIPQFRFKNRVLPLSLTFLSVLAVLNLTHQGLLYRALPYNFQDLVRNISLKTNTFIERKFFLLDGIKMSSYSPIIGFGGKGWASAYKMFQQTPYGSKELHNGYLEWLVDNGWIGLIMFILVLGILFYRIIKNQYLKEINKKSLSIITSLGIIFSHSFIDFNLSYGTIWLMILWLFVMGDSDIRDFKEKKGRKKRIRSYYLCLILFTILVVGNFFMVFNYTQAEAYYNLAQGTTSIDERIENIEIAIKKQPYNVEYLQDLGELYLQSYLITKDKDQYNKVVSTGQRLVKLEPNNGDTWSQVGGLYLGLGDIETAQRFFEGAFTKDRYNSHLNEILITVIINNAQKIQNRELAKEGIRYFETIEKTYEEFEAKNLDKAFNSRDFHISDETIIQAILAYTINEDYPKVIEIYNKNSHINDYRLKEIVAYSIKQTNKKEGVNKN